MGVRCGIDLGTTYSAVSWFDEYNNRVDTIDLEVSDGQKIVRSVVFYPADGGKPVVGETAWNAAKESPDRVVMGIKRSMGTDFKVPPIDGHAYTPPEVSSEILKVLAEEATRSLGEEVKDVVITVPAYFGDAERAATEEAGRLAGLNVLALLTEPHAAAIAYAVDKPSEIVNRNILVYDLGGGTFDVTLIHATTREEGVGLKLNIETLCKEGRRELGGLDWDNILAEIVSEKVSQQFGVDVYDNPQNKVILLDNCEKAKRHLSRTGSCKIVADLELHQVEVTVSEFEERSGELLHTTQSLLEAVLEEAESKHGLKKSDIDVMIVGGSSKMPMVKRMIEEVMGKAPFQHRNPELLVTAGAAYWAHLMQPGSTISTPGKDEDGNPTKKDMEVEDVSDVASFDTGIEVVRTDGGGQEARYVRTVVPKGARTGESFEQEFMTSEDNMREILIQFYTGSSEVLDECVPLKAFVISGLPGGRPRGQRVKLALSYNGNGILVGKAVDVSTGKEVEIQVERTPA